MKKIKVSKGSLNSVMEKAEELSFSEGDIDDKDVISRVKLF